MEGNRWGCEGEQVGLIAMGGNDIFLPWAFFMFYKMLAVLCPLLFSGNDQ